MVEIRSPHLTGVEVAWFAPLCGDDYRYLGVPDNALKSTFSNTSNILLTADKMGFCMHKSSQEVIQPRVKVLS